MVEQEERRILGLLLDFEYLLADVYERAQTGRGLSADRRGADAGPVRGGRAVNFTNSVVEAFVKEASRDAWSHIATFRRLLADLGEKPYAASSINLEDSFTAMANGAGLLRENQTLDAFANDTNLLLGVFMLEDVGVTLCAHALHAVDLMWSRELITGLCGSLASRSAIVRTFLFSAGLQRETNAIAVFRQHVCGLFATAYQGNDHGVGTSVSPSMMPVDGRGLSWSRTPDQCAAILVGSRDGERGSFFPDGLNAMRNQRSDRISLIPVNYFELSQGAVEVEVKLLASFESQRVEVMSVDLDPGRFQLRENTAHQPWTQSGYSSWAPRCIEVSNALVHGAVGIIGIGKHYIAETLWHTEARRHRYRMVGGAVELDLGAPGLLDGRTVSILVGAAESYWHVLIDAVARLVLVPDELWPKIDRVLFPSTGIRGREMLDLFGLPGRIETKEVWPHQSFRIASLVQPSSLHGLFDYHPTLLRSAFARLKSNVALKNQFHRRIFIDRRASRLRKLVNEDELIAALPDFTPVRLEDLSVAEQICLFANAEIIVAPHGAGLTNIGFARQGTIVIELMMDSYCNWCYRRLAAIMDLNYRCVFGRCLDLEDVNAIHFTTWSVDRDDLLLEVSRARELKSKFSSVEVAR